MLPLHPPHIVSTWQHITLGNQTVAYRLTRSRCRLSLTVDERGLRVAVPAGLTLRAVEDFIVHHEKWVLEQLAASAERRLAVRHGAHFPLFDGQGEIVIENGAHRARWQGARLILSSRTPECSAALTELARRALIERARQHFAGRLAHYCAHLGLPPPPLSLGAARCRWGSCSAGGIRLNWRLVHLPSALGDYVVAHEVAHLREMNHSPAFWRWVEALYPDWSAARRQLNRLGRTIPLL